jgi:predicted RNA binding protein YcfA (HicA-like mRNA interferase family)
LQKVLFGSLLRYFLEWPMLTDSRRIIQRLECEGWIEVRVVGSHHIYRKDGIREHIVVMHPKKDISLGVARKIHKIAGWPLR